MSGPDPTFSEEDLLMRTERQTTPGIQASAVSPDAEEERIGRRDGDYIIDHSFCEQTNMDVIKIQIISDINCPWCYVGSNNLKSILMRFPQRYHFDIEWKAYMCNPNLPFEGVDKVEYLKIRRGKDTADAYIKTLNRSGPRSGIRFNWNGVISNSLTAHRLLDYSRAFGVQDELAGRIFFECWEREKNIADVGTLGDISATIGLDRDEVVKYLNSDEGRDKIFQEDQHARTLGLSGVPTFFIGERKAENVEELGDILEKMIYGGHPEDTTSSSTSTSSQMCSMDGTCS
ncbi:Dsb family thioredoxin protein [Planoprotostelium fungivorum]|uniref:Dsb family thioredoxin protein n=1 Tax=Planoprotostelium fungivorum TaxID=1890364 RepID=A0A2P6NUX8_9EUKA|nr:Dsb family thioredoxin protein [Planoprotostelium fungivorum]